MRNSLTDGDLSETTRAELYALFHETPTMAEYWGYLRRISETPEALERMARIVLRRDEEVRERWQNSASQNTSALRELRELSTLDPLVALASLEEIEAAIKMAGFALSRQPSKDQIRTNARVIEAERWTRGEIDAAWRCIVYTPSLADKVIYAGSPNAAIFAAARKEPRVMMGRLHTEGEIRKWAAEQFPGDVNGQNRVLGLWCEPVIYNGVRYFVLRTIQDE